MIDYIIVAVFSCLAGMILMGLICSNSYSEAYSKGYEEGKIAERKRIIKEVNDAFCPKSNSDAS